MSTGESKLVGRLAPSPTGAAARRQCPHVSAGLAFDSVARRNADRADGGYRLAAPSSPALPSKRWPTCAGWGSTGTLVPISAAPLLLTFRPSDSTSIAMRSGNYKSPSAFIPAPARAATSRRQRAPHVRQEGPLYPGTCSNRAARDAEQFAGQPFAWRFRVTPERREFVDLVAGPQTCKVAEELGDFVVGKSDGSPAYQLAVVVDDCAMGVTEVLRGDDLLPSAFRQLELYEQFGWTPPSFAHVPLVIGPDGRRLAKRHGDTRLATLRDAGVTPERLIGLLALLLRIRETADPCRGADLLAGFDLARLPREPWVFGDGTGQTRSVPAYLATSLASSARIDGVLSSATLASLFACIVARSIRSSCAFHSSASTRASASVGRLSPRFAGVRKGFLSNATAQPSLAECTSASL